jgi:aminopeptidase-like protein
MDGANRSWVGAGCTGPSRGATQMDLLWFLNLADGNHSLLDMAIRADVPFARLEAAARLALEASLVGEKIQ